MARPQSTFHVVVYAHAIGILNVSNVNIVGLGDVQIGLCALLHGERVMDVCSDVQLQNNNNGDKMWARVYKRQL